MADEQSVTIDGETYKLDEMSEEARTQLGNVRVCDQRIQQLKTDLAIAQTARATYGQALTKALGKGDSVTLE